MPLSISTDTFTPDTLIIIELSYLEEAMLTREMCIAYSKEQLLRVSSPDLIHETRHGSILTPATGF